MEPSAGIGADIASGTLGVSVATMTWYQVITGFESIIIGALTIVLICIRIHKHLKE